MLRLRASMLVVLALLALLSPSLVAGLCVVPGGTAVTAHAPGEPASLPSPCDLMGGKRVMPAEPDLARRIAVELPRATDAQWHFGLTDDPTHEGRGPAMEPEPPRAA